MTTLVSFVDAGFLHAEGARTLGGQKSRYRLVAAQVVAWLEQLAAARSTSLLRTYWYDGGLDTQDDGYADQRRFHDALAHTPGIQLRLGHVAARAPRLRVPITRALENTARSLDLEPQALLDAFEQHWQWRPRQEQKGVDVLMALDLVRLAQRRAYDTAVLLSGDRDLCEAVRVVQDEGVRVVVAHPRDGGLAPELKQLADVVTELGPADLGDMLELRDA